MTRTPSSRTYLPLIVNILLLALLQPCVCRASEELSSPEASDQRSTPNDNSDNIYDLTPGRSLSPTDLAIGRGLRDGTIQPTRDLRGNLPPLSTPSDSPNRSTFSSPTSQERQSQGDVYSPVRSQAPVSSSGSRASQSPEPSLSEPRSGSSHSPVALRSGGRASRSSVPPLSTSPPPQQHLVASPVEAIRTPPMQAGLAQHPSAAVEPSSSAPGKRKAVDSPTHSPTSDHGSSPQQARAKRPRREGGTQHDPQSPPAPGSGSPVQLSSKRKASALEGSAPDSPSAEPAKKRIHTNSGTASPVLPPARTARIQTGGGSASPITPPAPPPPARIQTGAGSASPITPVQASPANSPTHSSVEGSTTGRTILEPVSRVSKTTPRPK